MKKLFALLLIAPMLFTACGDEEDEKPYFNPVEGEWVDTIDVDYITIRTFTRNFNASLKVYNEGKETKFDFGKYTINEDFIQYEKTGNKHHYIITEDSLYLVNKELELEERYIRKF